VGPHLLLHFFAATFIIGKLCTHGFL
jgi:hypothetical protein